MTSERQIRRLVLSCLFKRLRFIWLAANRSEEGTDRGGPQNPWPFATSPGNKQLPPSSRERNLFFNEYPTRLYGHVEWFRLSQRFFEQTKENTAKLMIAE
jgi:hypothetical protein